MFFICLFTIESLVKMYSVGFECYFASMFNRFDTFVIIFSWSEAALTYYDVINPVGVSVLRCARLLRVFKVTRFATVLQYRTVQYYGTAYVLALKFQNVLESDAITKHTFMISSSASWMFVDMELEDTVY
jgi:Ion transport protein